MWLGVQVRGQSQTDGSFKGFVPTLLSQRMHQQLCLQMLSKSSPKGVLKSTDIPEPSSGHL